MTCPDHIPNFDSEPDEYDVVVSDVEALRGIAAQADKCLFEDDDEGFDRECAALNNAINTIILSYDESCATCVLMDLLWMSLMQGAHHDARLAAAGDVLLTRVRYALSGLPASARQIVDRRLGGDASLT